MSCVDVRERWRDSPLRARSLLTVRAAISSARSSDLPCSSWLSLTCSYWRARFVPFLTPRGGIDGSPSGSWWEPATRAAASACGRPVASEPCRTEDAGREADQVDAERLACAHA